MLLFTLAKPPDTGTWLNKIVKIFFVTFSKLFLLLFVLLIAISKLNEVDKYIFQVLVHFDVFQLVHKALSDCNFCIKGVHALNSVHDSPVAVLVF